MGQSLSILFLALVRRGLYVRAMRWAGGTLLPEGRGPWRTRGKWVRPSWIGRVRLARVSTGRCLLIERGREGSLPVEGDVDQGHAPCVVSRQVQGPES